MLLRLPSARRVRAQPSRDATASPAGAACHFKSAKFRQPGLVAFRHVRGDEGCGRAAVRSTPVPFREHGGVWREVLGGALPSRGLVWSWPRTGGACALHNHEATTLPPDGVGVPCCGVINAQNSRDSAAACACHSVGTPNFGETGCEPIHVSRCCELGSHLTIDI